MKLYTHPLSGHAHRAQLFLSLAGVNHELSLVDLQAGAHKSEEFLAMNPFGQIPVLDDDGIIIADSNAIMVYIAKKNDLQKWYPTSPQTTAEIQRWLSIAAGPLAYGPAAARLVTLFGASFEPNVVIARAHQLYSTIEKILEGHTWLVSDDHPTIADIAIYSYTDRAPEGNVDLGPYPNVRAFLKRIEELPGFVPFGANPVGLLASQ